MEEIIEKLKVIAKLEELELKEPIDNNRLFLAILKAERYDLLKDSNLTIQDSNTSSAIELLDYLLSNPIIVDNLLGYGYYFSFENVNKFFQIVTTIPKCVEQFDDFISTFFYTEIGQKNLNKLVNENQTYFLNYIDNNDYLPDELEKCDNFVSLVLQKKRLDLVEKLGDFSIKNLKLLAAILKPNDELSLGVPHKIFTEYLFQCKDSLEPNEFYKLLCLLKIKGIYDDPSFGNIKNLFDKLVTSNLDYLFTLVSDKKDLPLSLKQSPVFRDACIARKRIDLAVQCLLPYDIIKDKELVREYAKYLGISEQEFYIKYKWVLNYYKKNKDVFDSLLGTTLRKEMGEINIVHFERLINDPYIQDFLAKLSPNELEIVANLINRFDYKDYDITTMVANIIKNIPSYQKLLANISIEKLNANELNNLIMLLNFKDNPYDINDLDSLNNYAKIREQKYLQEREKNRLNLNKENLLGWLFNIDLNEARLINKLYCYGGSDKLIIERLKNSELPANLYMILEMLNKIVETNDQKDLDYYSEKYQGLKVYDLPLPLESYLRGCYASLYSKCLYRFDGNEVSLPEPDKIVWQFNYNGIDIPVCIPQKDVVLLGHCPGRLSLDEDSYQKAWEEMPQMQDHFVACSCVNQDSIYLFVGNDIGVILYGFANLEGGSLIGLGEGDIDSIGYCSRLYDSSKELTANRNCHILVPSILLENMEKKDRYDEVVIERRNNNENLENIFKRKPDYIIMRVSSLNKDNFTTLEELFNQKFSFFSESDKNLLKQRIRYKDAIKLVSKYEEEAEKEALERNISHQEVIDFWIKVITLAKRFEKFLKAASDFQVPIVVLDLEHYFKLALAKSTVYDEEMKTNILNIYRESNNERRKELFMGIKKMLPYSELVKDYLNNTRSVSITA